MKTQTVCRIATIQQLDGAISNLDTLARHIGPNPGEDRDSLAAMPTPAGSAKQIGEVIIKPHPHLLGGFACSSARRDGV
ncbi:MAG: hypothetical protein KDA05_11555 [Phycisphaerales bacterium]|nr:hypothetical protein [Phycisphaerales bacterium]